MLKNKLNKINFICISLIFIFILFSNITYSFGLSEVISSGDKFIQDGVQDANPTIEENDLQEMSNLLYNTLLIIAIVIAVVWGMIIGIKFMTGSIEEKAKIKETLIPYIAGCIVIFGAFTIWALVVNIMNKVN